MEHTETINLKSKIQI